MRAVECFRAMPRRRLNEDFFKTKGDLRAIPSIQWPEAQARADEIVAAYDESCAAWERAKEDCGFNAAEKAHGEAVEDDNMLCGQL